MKHNLLIRDRTDLTVSQKSKKTYFTVEAIIADEDESGEAQRYICFDPGLHPELPIGTYAVLDVVPGKNPEDTWRIQRFKEDSKPQEPKPDSGKATTIDMPFPKHPLTLAVEYWTPKIQAGAECKIDDVLGTAEIFKQYMTGELKVEPIKLIKALYAKYGKEES